MRCEYCQGTGKDPKDAHLEISGYLKDPCPECYGNGITHCCEGSERHGQLPNSLEVPKDDV